MKTAVLLSRYSSHYNESEFSHGFNDEVCGAFNKFPEFFHTGI